MNLRLLSVVALLLLLFLIRAHHITAQDPYIDEGFHVARANVVWDFDTNPGRFAHGKVLLYFWLGIFESDQPTSLYTSRTGMALFALISGAVIYRLGRMFRDHPTGLLALGLYAILPLAFFYERLAFADPLASGLATLVVWRSLIFARRPTWREGLILGILIALATLAKLTMGLIPLIPVIAALVYYPWRSFAQIRAWSERYIPPLILAAVVVMVAWMPLAVPAYFAQDSDEPFVLVSSFNIQSADQNPSTQEYIREITPLITDFTTEAWFALAGLALLVWFIFKRGAYRHILFLLAWLLLLTVLSVVAARLISSRYFMPLAAPLVLLIAYCVMELWQLHDLRRWIGGAFLFGIGVWAVSFALPFAYHASENPQEVPLHGTNFTEYQSGFLTANSAVQAAGAYVDTLPDVPMYATWTVCDLLRFYSTADFKCLSRQTSPGELMDLVEADLEPGEIGYLVLSGYRPFFENIRHLHSEEIARYDPPQITRPVTIWYLQLR